MTLIILIIGFQPTVQTVSMDTVIHRGFAHATLDLMDQHVIMTNIWDFMYAIGN